MIFRECSFIFMDKWRLLLHQINDAFTNMALDESLLISGEPTIRFYKWKPSAISIGYFQGIHEEVNLRACRTLNVDVVRRITGGGAVYHDEKGEITYSLVAPERALPKNILKSCEKISSALVKGLAHMGVDAAFSPLNDVTVNGKKISGSAQTRRYGHVLQHGTLLLHVNTDTMFSLLNVSKKKIEDKHIETASKRVTCLSEELDEVNEKEVLTALKEGFEEEFDIEGVQSEITEQEYATMQKVREKYASREWNFKR